MTKLNLFDRETVRLISGLEDEILEIIDHREDFTRSDLQGAVQAKVINILRIGIEMAEK